MFLDILEFRVETKKKWFGKTVFKMWSQLCGKIAYFSAKLLLEKSAKTKKKNEEKK